MTVVGDRGVAQLQKAVRADLVTAVQNSTVVRGHFYVTCEVPETTKQDNGVTYGLGKQGRSSPLLHLR